MVSSFFADIFRGNALNNGLLPVQVSPEFLHEMFTAIEHDPQTKFIVSLEHQTIAIAGTEQEEQFDIDPFRKVCMINGYDDIDFLLSLRGEIEEFERGMVEQGKEVVLI